MSNPSDIGKSITENIRFVSRLGAECIHLTKLIKEELSRLLLAPEVSKRYRAVGGWVDTYASDDQNWVNTELGSSLPVIIKPKRSVGGYLVVQISLTGPGVDAKDNHEPLLHVGWWGNPLDFDEIQMGFPMGLENGYNLTLEEERLFFWSHSLFENEWCYSLRLTDINSSADVQTSIVKPIKALLLGGNASQALSGTAAVRYSKVEGEPGQYQTLPR
ncbi:hypothetical protein [Pseudomonas syringae group sp. 243L2]|uniref:hypothetical protein n=1 Tax=Pseudomonas syringae group sp. 243L2 TaxID=3079593 RepID=UPI002914F3E5|nr:hypothetical protein [Pseudomonas syringae group sp. 243L2]MDU8628226.1 hypothetical protein [Pseudomonas syringae group sp. 243L2]